MRFFDVPPCTYFAHINPYLSSLLLVKDGNGKVRRYIDYILVEDSGIKDDSEVQVILIKPLTS